MVMTGVCFFRADIGDVSSIIFPGESKKGLRSISLSSAILQADGNR